MVGGRGLGGEGEIEGLFYSTAQKHLLYKPDYLLYMSTTYRIRPKLDVFICLQMTLLYLSLGRKSKES